MHVVCVSFDLACANVVKSRFATSALPELKRRGKGIDETVLRVHEIRFPVVEPA